MESRVSSETAIAMGAESLCQDLFLALPQSQATTGSATSLILAVGSH